MTTPTPAEAVRILRDMRKLVTARADWQESLEAGAAALEELPKLRAERDATVSEVGKLGRIGSGLLQERDTARARVAELEREAVTLARDGVVDAFNEARDRIRALEALLGRAVKYAREDRMRTPGVTRLARVLDEARALLETSAATGEGS